MSVLVAISHKDREPFRSARHHHLSEGWLSSNLPDGIEAVFFEGKKLGAGSDCFDRLHERARWAPRIGSLVYRVDRFWASTRPSVVPSYKVLGRSQIGVVSLRVAIEDFLSLASLKCLGVFQYFLEQSSAKYLFSTTVGNFIRPVRLLSLLDYVPERSCYAGTVGYVDGPFVSGANRLMSRDVVARLVEAVDNLDMGLLEDVAFGRVVEAAEISPTQLATLNLQSRSDLESVTDRELEKFHQIRVKSLSNRLKNDLEILKLLDERFQLIDQA